MIVESNIAGFAGIEFTAEQVGSFIPFAQQQPPTAESVCVRLANGGYALCVFDDGGFTGELIYGSAAVSWIRLEDAANKMDAGMVSEEISERPSGQVGLETPASVTDEEAAHDDATQA